MDEFYWFRQGNPTAVLPWIAVTMIWLAGGWLIATHAFRLEKRERLFIGIGLGLVNYLWFANILGHWLSPVWTFSLAALSVLLIGCLFAWRDEKPLLDWKDFEIWPLLVAGLAMAFVFTRVSQGLPLFDDHKNLSIISTMAAGDIPPHFYMNSGFYFSYHYGFQLLGASLMRLGGLFPWSAFDFSKALVGTYLILLVYLLSYRYVKNEFIAALVTLVFTFASGTRYLLLLLPHSIQATLLLEVGSQNALKPLSELLVDVGRASTGPPISFPYAYLGGIVAWPRFMGIQAGPSTMGMVTLVLAWLLISHSKRNTSFVILIGVYSVWAMSWESSFALFVAGGFFTLLYQLWRRGLAGGFDKDMLALALSIPISFVQGGTLTEVLRKIIWGPAVTSVIPSSASIAGFSLRWPLAFESTYFGELSITSPGQLLVAFCEMGPVLLLVPWITAWAWRRFRQGEWSFGALSLSAWVGFVAPIFLRYENDRDITRFPAHAVTVWTLFLALMVWEDAGLKAKLFKWATASVLALTVFGGVVITGAALTASARTVLSTIITPLDALISKDAWDILPAHSEVFDPKMWRATALTGRLSRAALKTNVPSPEWELLKEEPSVEALLAKGYSFAYIDEEWWSGLSSSQQTALSPACARVVSEHREQKRFRRLIDLTPCKLTSDL